MIPRRVYPSSNYGNSSRAIAESKLISASAVTPSIREFFKNPLSAEMSQNHSDRRSRGFPEMAMGLGAAAGAGASAMDFI